MHSWLEMIVHLSSGDIRTSCSILHRSLLHSSQVRRIHLDELGDINQQPIGISLLQLTKMSKRKMATQSRLLLARVEQGDGGLLGKNDIIEVITTIAVYKFTNLSRAEVEAMLGIAFEETRIYREVKEEGRVEGREQGISQGKEEVLARTIPMLLEAGFTLEQIAQRLGVELEVVRRLAEQSS
jgi:predicted transposase/invertase (TIGR01784 family)